jgi:hypothetical protein
MYRFIATLLAICLLTMGGLTATFAATYNEALDAYRAGDRPLARQILNGLAEKRDPRVMYLLGRMMRNGQGGIEDPEMGLLWLRRAAEAGHIKAMKQVGWIAVNVPDGREDWLEGCRWLTRAAEEGIEDVLVLAAACYLSGYGAPDTPQDLVKAYGLALVGTNLGYESLANLVPDFEAELTARQLDDGLQFADRIALKFAPSQEPEDPKPAPTQPAPTAIPDPKPAPADPVLKEVPDDLFGTLAPANPEPTNKPAVRAPDISVEGCFDLSQSQTQCLQACDSAEFSAKYAGSHIVFKLGAGADVAACHDLCGAAAVGFDTAQNNVAVLADTKFFCPMLFSEAAFLLKKNGVPRTYGDKSLMWIEADAFAAFWKATRRESTPDARAVLTTTPFPTVVKQMVDAMPARLDGCYDTTGALQICLGKCESMKTISVAGLPAGALFNACTFGCDVASQKFNDSFIWTKELTDQGEYGGVCDRIHFGSKDIAVDEIKNETRALGFAKKETSAAIRGLREFWGTAHSLGVR